MSTLRGAAALLLALSAAPAAAGEPLYLKNLSPLANLFGLPAQRSADWAEGLGAAVHMGLANHWISDRSAGERLLLDGETLRVALELRYGFQRDWDLQLELPWLQHDGGRLDPAIDGWHDLWGLPDGGRDRAPRNRLEYRYEGPGDAFRLHRSAAGAGDPTLSLNRTLYRRGGTVLGLGLGYKFGSGDAGDFLGSGSDDVYATLRLSVAGIATLPLELHGQAGYLWAGDSEPLAGSQRDGLWFAGLSADFAAWEAVSLLAQLDLHQAPATSGLAALGDPAALLGVGLRWWLHRHWSLEFSVTEDIAVETAPDVTFQTSLRYRPD